MATHDWFNISPFWDDEYKQLDEELVILLRDGIKDGTRENAVNDAGRSRTDGSSSV